MNARLPISIVVMAIALSACSPMLGKEEGLVRDAFNAVKDNEVDGYLRLTRTTADICLDMENMSPFKRPLSYQGSVLAPQQRVALAKEFAYLASGLGPDGDLKDAQFIAAKKVDTHQMEILCDKASSIPVSVYAIVVRREGKEAALAHTRVILTADPKSQPRVLGFQITGPRRAGDEEEEPPKQ